MQTILISFATKEFKESQKQLEASALNYGVDKVISYTKTDLTKTLFFKQHKEILKQKRGAGYWLWKPFFILNTLENINENDILIYSDAGVRIKKDLSPLIDYTQKQGYLFFKLPMLQKNWTKRDCFIMMDCDTETYWNTNQTVGTVLFVQKKEQNIEFIRKWLCFSANKYIITDLPNICRKPNIEGFKEHRHDQSILTNLTVKYNLERKDYDTLIEYFDIHRSRNVNITYKIKHKIKKIIKSL